MVYALAWIVTFPDEGDGEGEYVIPFNMPTSEREARGAACSLWHAMTGTAAHMPNYVKIMPLPRTQCTADGAMLDEDNR
jgi:hypothetical protein